MASASSDISSSPPGKAQLDISLASTPVLQDIQFTDTNPGRPNGPKLTVSPGWFVFPMPGNVASRLYASMLTDSGESTIGSAQIGSCQLSPPYGGGEYWWPGGADAIYCPDATNTGGGQYPATESIVNKFVAELRAIKPIYVVNWDPNNFSGCNVAIYPSGRVKHAPGFSQSCSKFVIKVN
jgi:hypothetical protein